MKRAWTGCPSTLFFRLYTAIDEYSRFRYLKHLRSKAHIARRCFLSICRKDFRLKLSVFRQIMVMSLPKFWATQKIRSRQCLTTNSNNTVFAINSSDRIHPDITARLSVHTVRITNIFMLRIKFYSFDDFVKQLKVYNYNYNKFPMRPLNWKSPADYIRAFLVDGENFFKV